MNENKSEFEPKIVAFVCNWCTYAGADLTGTSRLKYATNVEIVRFPCTGRIDFMLLLKAFAGGRRRQGLHRGARPGRDLPRPGYRTAAMARQQPQSARNDGPRR